MSTLNTPHMYQFVGKKTPNYFKRLVQEISLPSSCSIYQGSLSESSRSESKHLGILIVPTATNLTEFIGYIVGPPDSPYENAVYEISILVSGKYPFEAPKVTFHSSSRPWHPNVSSATGYICVSVLSQWQPTTSLKDILLALQVLLQCPNWDDPQDQQVQLMYRQDPEAFLKKAKNWAEQHAHPVDTIEWLCQSVPTAAETELARDEIAKAVSGQSGQSGERKMESTSVKSGSATESSSSSSVLGSFRMSTKKKEMTGGDQSDRLCGSICQTQ